MEITAQTPVTNRARINGHFGEWLQGRMGPEGPVVLVSLPCPEFWCEVQARPQHGLGLSPDHPILTKRRVSEILDTLGISHNLSITISGNIPFGAGLGASTASLVALIKAVADEAQSADSISQVCLTTEGATDPLMHEDFDSFLWSSREGRVVQYMQTPPTFEVIGGLWGETEKTDPKDACFPDISDLIQPWKRAVRAGSLVDVARIASVSAWRTTALRGPEDDPTEAIAGEFGALGHIRAHTGSARGLLFKPGTVPPHVIPRLEALGYRHTTRFVTGA